MKIRSLYTMIIYTSLTQFDEKTMIDTNSITGAPSIDALPMGGTTIPALTPPEYKFDGQPVQRPQPVRYPKRFVCNALRSWSLEEQCLEERMIAHAERARRELDDASVYSPDMRPGMVPKRLLSPEELRAEVYSSTMFSYYSAYGGRLIMHSNTCAECATLVNGIFVVIAYTGRTRTLNQITKKFVLASIEQAIIVAPLCKRLSSLMNLVKSRGYCKFVPTLFNSGPIQLTASSSYNVSLMPYVNGKPSQNLSLSIPEMMKITHWCWFQSRAEEYPRVFDLLLGGRQSNIVKIMRTRILLADDAWNVVEDFLAYDIVIFKNDEGEIILPRCTTRKIRATNKYK